MHATDIPDDVPPTGGLGDDTLNRLLGVNDALPVALPRVERSAPPVRPPSAERGLWETFIAGPKHDPDGRWHDGMLSVLSWGAIAAVLLTLAFLIIRGLQVFGAI